MFADFVELLQLAPDIARYVRAYISTLVTDVRWFIHDVRGGLIGRLLGSED